MNQNGPSEQRYFSFQSEGHKPSSEKNKNKNRKRSIIAFPKTESS